MLLYVSVVIIFNGWKVFHYMDLPQIVYQFISQWTFGLFPTLLLIWIKHLWTLKYKSFCHRKVSFFLCKYLEVKLLVKHGKYMFNFIRKCDFFQRGETLRFHQWVNEHSICPPFSPIPTPVFLAFPCGFSW